MNLIHTAKTAPSTLIPKILVVDNEPAILSSVGRMLVQEQQFETVFASSADEALRLAMTEHFAVVVSDCQMPVMDGVTLLRRLRELSPETTRILLTGYADMSLALKAINQGEVFRFLTKPWQADEFLLALQQGIAKHDEAMSLQYESSEKYASRQEEDSVVQGEVVAHIVEAVDQISLKPNIGSHADPHNDPTRADVLGPILFSSQEFYRRFGAASTMPTIGGNDQDAPYPEENLLAPNALRAGMVISRDVCLSNGACLLRANSTLQEKQLSGLLHILSREADVPEIYVFARMGMAS